MHACLLSCLALGIAIELSSGTLPYLLLACLPACLLAALTALLHVCLLALFALCCVGSGPGMYYLLACLLACLLTVSLHARCATVPRLPLLRLGHPWPCQIVAALPVPPLPDCAASLALPCLLACLLACLSLLILVLVLPPQGSPGTAAGWKWLGEFPLRVPWLMMIC